MFAALDDLIERRIDESRRSSTGARSSTCWRAG